MLKVGGLGKSTGNCDAARLMAAWVMENLGPDVPLHFVRFHPSHKLTATVRTPVDRLRRAREIALGLGMKYVYLGNVYDDDLTSTWCLQCRRLLVRRFGLSTRIEGLDENGCCSGCGTPSGIITLGGQPGGQPEGQPPFDDAPAWSRAPRTADGTPLLRHYHAWHDDLRS